MLYGLYAQLVVGEDSQVHFPKFLRYLIYKAAWRKFKKKKKNKVTREAYVCF